MWLKNAKRIYSPLGALRHHKGLLSSKNQSLCFHCDALEICGEKLFIFNNILFV